jgi:DNA topoisomerase VI subunit B
MAGKVHASELAKAQKQISVAEFFEKNRHLLGFDNPRRALLTTIKEAVDNALDACEEARILPEISVEIIQLNESRYRVIVEDNGPGIIKKQVPNIFARLLYGSKFHKLAQTRGQQGIGISASVLYGQLTTGKPAKVMTKIDAGNKGYGCKVKIDTFKNLPVVSDENEFDWEEKDHGTRVEIDLEGHYQKGRQSVDEYIKQTAIVNPHTTLIYTDPNAEQLIFPRVAQVLPPEAKEIRPHPYGLELGILMKMLKVTSEKTLVVCFQK